MTYKSQKTDEDWRKELDEETYYVTRRKGTERAFTGKYDQHWETGIYACTCCGADLFRSDTKFDAGCGWPSYFQALNKDAIKYEKDTSHGMIRTEVMCARCDAHLGHVFPDGPAPTGKRYCINSVSMTFTPEPLASRDD